jgi:hypothetical protein
MEKSMEPIEQANLLLGKLGKELAIAELALDEEHMGQTLAINDFMLYFALSEDTEELLSSIYIAEAPEGPHKEELLLELMRANYAWRGTDGGILGLDEDLEFVTHSQLFYLPLTSEDAFLTVISRQVQLAEYWREVLAPAVGPQTAPVA